MMKKLMNVLMLSCRKASELIDKRSLAKLSTKEKVMLHMHTSMCDACAAYQKQSRAIDGLLHKHLHHTDEAIPPQVVNDKLKDKIISKL
jgi:anti-sigma factor RsiW